MVKGDRAVANGFTDGSSDLLGFGILVSYTKSPPAGRNVALGNDDPTECSPTYLC